MEIQNMKHDILETAAGRNRSTALSSLDMRTFEEIDQQESVKYWKTAEDIMDPDYEFFTKESEPEHVTMASAPEPEHLENESPYLIIGETYRQSGKLVGTMRAEPMSPETYSDRGTSFSETPGYTCKESRRMYNKKNSLAKPKGKMRQSEHRKQANVLLTAFKRLSTKTE